MAGSAARPERGNTKIPKNGPETTEQQRVRLGGRHTERIPCRRCREAALSLADLFFFFIFFLIIIIIQRLDFFFFSIYFRPFYCVSLPPEAVEDAARPLEVQRAVGTEAPVAAKT